MTLHRTLSSGLTAAVLAALIAFGPRTAVAGTIRISGTGGAIGTMRILGEAFHRARPDIQVVKLPTLGSSGAIKAVLAGKLDIGLSARPLKDGERARGVVARAYARTPFVFGANESVKADGLTLSDLADIFAGKMDRWKDGRRLRLVLRPPGESDLEVLQAMSPRMKEAVTDALRRDGMIVTMTDQDAADAIERTPGALGVVSLSLILSERRAIRTIALDGVVPSVRTMNDGSYPHFKTYYLVTKRQAPPAVREFLDFVRSPKGAAILSGNGQAAVR